MSSTEDIWIPFIPPNDRNSSLHSNQKDAKTYLMLSPDTTMTVTSNAIEGKNTTAPHIEQDKLNDSANFYSISHRLVVRTHIQNRLCVISDIMCSIGVLGIILMIVENEITFTQFNDSDTNLTLFLKLTISISTFTLLLFIVYYHYLDLNLYSINNSLEDWRIAITYTKLLSLLTELIICAIHPMPRSFPHYSNNVSQSAKFNVSFHTPHSLSYIAVDVALGLPMFARLYLVCRFVMFHSYLFQDASSRSVGYLNKISINFFFLIKTYLEQWPISCLTMSCTILFFIGSWCLRACNYLPNNDHVSILDSMWLFIVTFSTVGYGDLTPSTYCGRVIATIVSLIGVFLSAIIVAVLAQKLLLNRWEKYVHNFALNIELARRRRIQSANVVKLALKAWHMKNKKGPGSSGRYLKAQRDLFQSVHLLRETKRQQRRLIDHCADLIDVITIQRKTSDKMLENSNELRSLKGQMNNIEEKLGKLDAEMHRSISDVQNKLNILLDKFVK